LYLEVERSRFARRKSLDSAPIVVSPLIKQGLNLAWIELPSLLEFTLQV